MPLRDGWFITDAEDGERLTFKLVNGSPYQVRIDPDGESAIVGALEPGYYDDELNQIDEADAVEPAKA